MPTMLNFAKKTWTSLTSDTEDDPFVSVSDRAVHVDDSPVTIEERHRQELLTHIVDLSKKVWFGLYQVKDSDRTYHVDRLRKLYLGAGMSRIGIEENDSLPNSSTAGLGLLEQTLSTAIFRGRGLAGLTLYDGLSLGTLRSVIELLEAYEREIEPFGQVYSLLRQLQIETRLPTPEDEQKVLTDFPPQADPIAKRLLHYDARLDVLGIDIEDEASAIHGDSTAREGWLVIDRVLKRPRKAAKSLLSFPPL
jgi:hypothetical protein